MSVQVVGRPLEEVGIPRIVVVVEDEECGARGEHTGVGAAPAAAGFGRVDHRRPGAEGIVSRCDQARNSFGVTAVVDDDALPRGQSLGRDVRQSAPQVIRAVFRADDDRHIGVVDSGVGHCDISFS
ncbi:hypothetical protein QE428_000289 [Microbacterium sp. SORGH_AS 505]|nr:hypothetical protein [Microbacterium sp. SORGH_AS_0505]MDQ1125256.1 hypothetical protein [Microbacterium sp. SORGH_AS_0505]